MTFKTKEELVGLSSIDIICQISENPSVTEIDEKLMVVVARKMGFPNAKATTGIMYLDPPHEQPMGVDQFAQMVVKAGNINCAKHKKK